MHDLLNVYYVYIVSGHITAASASSLPKSSFRPETRNVPPYMTHSRSQSESIGKHSWWPACLIYSATHIHRHVMIWKLSHLHYYAFSRLTFIFFFFLQKNGTPISYLITVLVVNIAKNAVNISYLLQGSLPECPSPPPPWIRPRPPCSTANPRRSSIHSRHHPVHGV